MIDTLSFARALLDRRAMQLRLLVAEVLADPTSLSTASEPKPAGNDERAAAAALVELLCERVGIVPPEWVAHAPALEEPLFVLAHAPKMPRLRALCLEQSPAPLRRRGFLAPPDFLTMA